MKMPIKTGLPAFTEHNFVLYRSKKSGFSKRVQKSEFLLEECSYGPYCKSSFWNL